MSAIEILLGKLAKVKRTGDGKWLACCPAHDDKQPSLAIRETRDGRILLHDFSGCETEAVLSAVGLTFRDLMPESLGDLPRVRPAFTAMDALQALSFEAGLVSIAAADVAEGKPVSAVDSTRVCTAAGRIATALEFVHG